MKTIKNKNNQKVNNNVTRRRKLRGGSEKEKCTKKPNGKYQIGTSGFMVSQSVWFKLDCLNCIEINSSFYRLPSPETIEKWRNFPENVNVSIKASKYITHIKRLHDVEEGVRLFAHKVRCAEGAATEHLYGLEP